MAPFQTHTARLVRTTILSDLTKHLEFEMPGISRFGFVPGQRLSFKQFTPSVQQITRAYSIASPPSDDNRFALCLHRAQDLFMSNCLSDIDGGDDISPHVPF